MEDPNEEEWRIQEFRPPDKNAGRLRQIWNNGLNLGKKIALTGIVVSAAPLALPPLVVLSAFGVAFIVPFGFYFASYAATDKIMRALLTMPNQPQPPLLIQSGDVFGDEIEKAYEYSDDKVEEEGYDLEEKEKELEDHTTLACKVRSVLDEENNEIRDGSEFSVDTSSQLGIDEVVKDIGDVIVDKFEQDGYEEDDGEYMEKEEPVPRIASEILKEIREVEEISSMEEGRGKMLGIGVEVGVVSVEVVGENDIDVDQVEVVHVFGPQVSMEDSRSMVKFGDVELEELEKNTAGMSESIRDEGVSETKRSMEKEEPSLSIASEILKGIREAEEEVSLLEEVDVHGPQVSMEGSRPKVNFGNLELRELERESIGMIESNIDDVVSETRYLEHLMENEEPIPSIASEILKGIKEGEEDMSLVEEGSEEEMHGNCVENDINVEQVDVINVEQLVVSAEVGGENDINVEQVDVIVPRVSMEDSIRKVKLGDVEPEELERETTGMIESIREEGLSETKNHEHSMEKAEPIPSRASEITKGFREAGEELPLVEEGMGENLQDGAEAVVMSAEVGGENDIYVDQVKVQERETTGMTELVKDEDASETTNNELIMETEQPIPSIASEILKGIRDAEEEMPLLEEGRGEKVGNGVEVVVLSSEAGGENRIDVEQMDLFGPHVSMEDKSPKVKFGDVEPEELERETAGMIESLRNEGTSEAKNHEHSRETADESIRNIDGIQQVFVPSVSLQKDSGPVKSDPGESGSHEAKNANLHLSAEKTSLSPGVNREELRITDDLEKLMVPSEKGTVDTIAVLQEHSIIVSTSRDTRRDDVAVAPKEEIQDTKHNAMFVIPREGTEGTGSTMGLLVEEGERIVADTDPVCVRKLVVHVNRSGDSKATSIGGATAPNTRGETLILRRADTRGTAAASELSLLGQDNEVQDRRPRSANNHPEGIYLNSGDIQDASLHDQELPTKPIEGLNNEVIIWKQINAMRTIVGYEAQPHVSCVEEIKALYVFTGVEPPASFNEPLSIDDVYEKLLFLMAVVGVDAATFTLGVRVQ